MVANDLKSNLIEEGFRHGKHPADYDSSIIMSYLCIKESVIESGYSGEIDWQTKVNFESLSESEFLREYAWVVLSSGMRESVVRGLFCTFSKAFYDWKLSSLSGRNVKTARKRALRVFNSERKVDAIVYAINTINEIGFASFKRSMSSSPLTGLRTLPYIGPITCFHLAKNIGVDVAKPDRHLSRLSKSLGYDDVQDLCEAISSVTGDKISVVDLILWRYATITPDYLTKFVDLVKSFSGDFKNSHNNQTSG